MPNKSKPDSWTSEQKFRVVLETSGLNEHELGEYCREKGLYKEQIDAWRQACMSANESEMERKAQQIQHTKMDRKKIKKLEGELRRKDKALAEAAALLILQKKAQALWGEPEDD